MVFLAGLGHTAHVFDEFAPRFTDEYHVVGITRRGFGASSQPSDGYTLDTLVHDLKLVLDSLSLDNVILVGHSLGGDEITKFSARYSEKIAAVVYLEGAFDWVTMSDSLSRYQLPELHELKPSPHDLTSAEAYLGFYERSNGVRMPLGEIRAMYNWKDDGSFGGAKTPGRIYGQIIESLPDPVYAGISLPALAIYGVEYPIEELFSDFAQADTVGQRLMRSRYEVTKRLGSLSQERFRELMTAGSIVTIQGAGHSLYITHADQVERKIRSFLSNLPDISTKNE